MYCNKCGAKILENNAFCSKCGTKIEQISKNAINKSTEIEDNPINEQDKLENQTEKADKLKNNKNKVTISIICGIVAIVVLISAIIMINQGKSSDEIKLQYNIKYVYESTYITFFEDGTYERDVEEITKANYTFNKETNEIICKEIQLVYGDEIDLEMHYEYLNENEIRKTSMKVLGKEFNGEYGQVFSTKNTLKEKEEKTEEQESIKDTRMLHEEDDYEYIGFSSNSLQRMLIAFYEDGRLGIRNYTLNKRNGQYEQVGDIQWGTYQVKHNVIYAGNAMMTITSPDEVSKVQLFKYNGMEFTAIKVNNGNNNTNTDNQAISTTNEQGNSYQDGTLQNNNSSGSNNDYSINSNSSNSSNSSSSGNNSSNSSNSSSSTNNSNNNNSSSNNSNNNPYSNSNNNDDAEERKKNMEKEQLQRELDERKQSRQDYLEESNKKIAEWDEKIKKWNKELEEDGDNQHTKYLIGNGQSIKEDYEKEQKEKLAWYDKEIARLEEELNKLK